MKLELFERLIDATKVAHPGCDIHITDVTSKKNGAIAIKSISPDVFVTVESLPTKKPTPAATDVSKQKIHCPRRV
ncbi:hypothetical protein IV487_01890 [Enterococcus saccharolyticus]|uniref:hypothetical protein n=1 Tax=Enterococcus saccharolyticus TaxID=41997 RepID=UPI001E36DF9C|nr:hypothetical protein [Enterococcus saccharolyticus]MCD5001215.1 hypothetical protein [Enterococcus saccharolyticus]